MLLSNTFAQSNKDITTIQSSVINQSKQSNTIYKQSLFKGMNKKESSSLKRKLLKNKDLFVETYHSNINNKDVLIQLKKDWIAYALNIYTDINIIHGSNTHKDKKEKDIAFVLFINKEYQ